MKHIVTREKFQDLICRGDETAMHAIGKALVHLFNRQTVVEQKSNDTRYHNEMGFTPADAHSGCLTAKYYLRHGKLEDWQIQRWIRPNKKGVPRLAKYWRQIDEEAQKKALRKIKESENG